MTLRMLVFSLLGALGCSGAVGTCLLTQSLPAGYTTCVQYNGTNYGPAAATADCARNGGTYSMDPCAATDAGTCTFNGGTENEIKDTYDTSASDGGADVRDVCSAAGGFYAAF